MATYIAIAAAAHPEWVRDMLRLLVREGHEHGGTGWLKYDSIFCKNNSGPSARWDHLDPSLLTIVTNQGYPPRPPCHYCQELDHAAQDCALAPFEQHKAVLIPRNAPLSRKGKQPAPYDPTSPNPRYGPLQDYPTDSGGTHYPANQRPICISWNNGQCVVPNGCSYAHICPTCSSETRRAWDCPKTPIDYLQEANTTAPVVSTAIIARTNYM